MEINTTFVIYLILICFLVEVDLLHFGKSVLDKEVESVTKRDQRIGACDLDLVKKSVQVSGISSMALCKMDVLSGLQKIDLIMDGKTVQLDGWELPDNVESSEDLPAQVFGFIDCVENFLGVPIKILSVGPDRKQTLREE